MFMQAVVFSFISGGFFWGAFEFSRRREIRITALSITAGLFCLTVVGARVRGLYYSNDPADWMTVPAPCLLTLFGCTPSK
jgi:hypothetical protein